MQFLTIALVLSVSGLVSNAVRAQSLFGRGNQDQRCFTAGATPGYTPGYSLKASFKTGDDVRGTPLVLPDGTVVIASIDHFIYFLRPNGTLRSKFKTQAGVQASAALGKNGSVIIGSGDGNARDRL
jgi:hypothetical protein